MKKELLKGETFTFTSEKDIAEIHFAEHINKFAIWFNAKLETFKTFAGMENRLNKLIEKFGLTQSENL